jgi:AcrR family transcriptional regulator
MKSRKRGYKMDARSQQVAATRDRICEALIALYRVKSLDDFTLEDVARRAGTTVQTVLRAFKSKDNLVFEALERLTTRGSPHYAGYPGGLRLTPSGDIAAAVAEIFSTYEIIGDMVIRNLNDEDRNPALKSLLAHGREHHREWLRAVFASQLRQRSGAARERLFNCLVVATDVYTWKILRRDMKLGRPGAEAVVRQLITSVTKERADDTLPLAELVGRRQPAA